MLNSKSTDCTLSRAMQTQFQETVYCLNGIGGDGSWLIYENASKVSSGFFSVSRGGIGTNTLSSIIK